ncbi:MAG: PIN domain-containing protein [Desulfurococcales archaeon]|nr:PIN domain-containing protein [Desulfurococcales archaeon]
MRKLFIDANILIRIIVGKEYDFLKYLVGTEPYTSTTVLEEVAYKIIALSVIEAKRETLGAYKVKKLFEKGVAEDLIKSRLTALNKLVEKLNIISPILEDFETSKDIIAQYKLLPNDALIVAIMQRKNISLLLTLDSDFKRTPWIKVIP